jgi:hypothetical protein
MVLRNVQQHPAGAAGARSLATIDRTQPRPAVPSADRAFKVLKSSHAPTQLSLFSTRGTVLGAR